MFISTAAKHFALARCVPQLEQLQQGLMELGVLQLMKENPDAGYKLLTYSTHELTSDDFFDLFTPIFSPTGSNQKDAEETALYQWANYLQSIVGTCH